MRRGGWTWRIVPGSDVHFPTVPFPRARAIDNWMLCGTSILSKHSIPIHIAQAGYSRLQQCDLQRKTWIYRMVVRYALVGVYRYGVCGARSPRGRSVLWRNNLFFFSIHPLP